MRAYPSVDSGAVKSVRRLVCRQSSSIFLSSSLPRSSPLLNSSEDSPPRSTPNCLRDGGVRNPVYGVRDYDVRNSLDSPARSCPDDLADCARDDGRGTPPDYVRDHLRDNVPDYCLLHSVYCLENSLPDYCLQCSVYCPGNSPPDYCLLDSVYCPLGRPPDGGVSFAASSLTPQVSST